MRIALDIMGGDNAPHSNILGAKSFIDSTPDSNTKIIFVGPKNLIEKELDGGRVDLMEKRNLKQPVVNFLNNQRIKNSLQI